MQLFQKIKLKLKEFSKSDKGATAIEYALVVFVVAIGCITAFRTLGGNITSKFNTIGTDLTNAKQ